MYGVLQIFQVGCVEFLIIFFHKKIIIINKNKYGAVENHTEKPFWMTKSEIAINNVSVGYGSKINNHLYRLILKGMKKRQRVRSGYKISCK